MLSLVPWAFAAGIVAAVNPCGFALLPGYMTRFLGDEQAPAGRRGAIHGTWVGLAVTAGKLSVFAVLAAVILAGTRSVLRIGPWAGAAMGALVVAMGLWTLAGRAFHLPMPVVRAPTTTGYRGAYLFGVAYGVCSMSCCLPIFIGVFGGLGGGLAASVTESTVLFGAYAVGVAVLLVPLFAVTGRLREGMIHRVRKLARIASPLSGVLLILAGALLLVSWVPVLGGDLRVSPLARVVLSWQSWGQRTVLRFGGAFWLVLGLTLLGLVLIPALRRKERPRVSVSDRPAE